MPKIGYSANGFGKFCEVYEAVEASAEAVDAVGGLVDAVEAARGRIDGNLSSFLLCSTYVFPRVPDVSSVRVPCSKARE